MSVPKTKPTEVSAESYIAAIANEEQRNDAQVAAGIPAVALIMYDLVQYGRLGTSLSFLPFWYIIIPGILAAISGFLIGADILNPDKVRSAHQAAARGLYVSLAAWLLFVPILSMVAGKETT